MRPSNGFVAYHRRSPSSTSDRRDWWGVQLTEPKLIVKPLNGARLVVVDAIDWRQCHSHVAVVANFNRGIMKFRGADSPIAILLSTAVVVGIVSVLIWWALNYAYAL